MDLGHAESADGVTLEVEFDQHHGLPAHNPTVMPRLDRDDLGGLVFDDATVGVLDVDFAARQKAHVGVHTQVSPDDRFHVNRPPESGGVHHALDARSSGASNFKANASDFPALGALHSRDERIQAFFDTFTFLRATFLFAMGPRPSLAGTADASTPFVIPGERPPDGVCTRRRGGAIMGRCG